MKCPKYEYPKYFCKAYREGTSCMCGNIIWIIWDIVADKVLRFSCWQISERKNPFSINYQTSLGRGE